VRAWFDASGLQASSLRPYISVLRQVLDFTLGDQPNPARHPSVKLPRKDEEEPNPLGAAHVRSVLDRLAAPYRLAFVTIEQTGMTVGELESLAWGDVDLPGCQFRIARRNVKRQIRARARWVQCPFEDRTAERRVFPTFNGSTFGKVLGRACKQAGIPHYTPHELRHRRLSLWHLQDIPARELAERAGHAKASMSLDVYSHVMLDRTELTRQELETLL
jgi:integrase